MKRKLFWVWDNLEALLCVFFYTVMFVVLLVQVILRYVFSNGLVWAEEAAKYSMQWLIYISLSLAVAYDDHIRIDVVLKLWPRKLRRFIAMLGSILLLVFGVFMAYQGFKYTGGIFRQGARGSAFRILLGYVYLAIPVGYTLMSVRSVERIVKMFRPAEKTAADTSAQP